MSAQELVNEAAGQTTLQWESLISQLAEEEDISNDKAREEIAMAFIEWRKNRPDTVTMKVLRAIAFGLPIPTDLSFTDED